MERERGVTEYVIMSYQVWWYLSLSGVEVLPLTLQIGISDESLLILTPQICGVLLVWGRLCMKPIHLVPKNNKVIFFLYLSHFRSQLRLWYSDISSIVSSTIDLTRAPYNLFGSYYSVIFILNPYPARNYLKNLYLGPPIPYFSERDKWLLTLIGR